MTKSLNLYWIPAKPIICGTGVPPAPPNNWSINKQMSIAQGLLDKVSDQFTNLRRSAIF